VLVIGSLLFKRQHEKPKRPWRIWCVPRIIYTSGAHTIYRLFDVSKQVVGQMFVHGVNVLISDVGSARSSGNACVFYFLNILIDTTLGVSLCTSPSFKSLMLCFICQVSVPSTLPSISSHGSLPTSSSLRAFSRGNTALHLRSIFGRVKLQSMSSPSLP
jgi:hypothetical protein